MQRSESRLQPRFDQELRERQVMQQQGIVTSDIGPIHEPVVP
jgi:hypothetical protein